MVVDTSILLSIFLGENHAEWAADKLEENRGQTVMSTVNLAETLNLGDCFAYALACAEGCGILTLDRDFRSVDVPVDLP